MRSSDLKVSVGEGCEWQGHRATSERVIQLGHVDVPSNAGPWKCVGRFLQSE